MPLSAQDEAFISKAGSASGLPPEDDKFVERALRELPNSEILASSKGKPSPDWGPGLHFLDAISGGQLTGSKDSSTTARAKAQWEQDHPGEAWNATVAAHTIAPALLATGAGRVARVATEAAGIPAAGEALTGAAGSSWPVRALSSAVSGAWQGAMPNVLYGDQGGDLGTNMLTGAGIGAGIGALMAPLRSNISPDIAQRARDYIAQGLPLRTSQIPGAPLASRVMAKISGMGQPDLGALTKRIIASTGSDGERLDYATIEAAKDAIGHRLDTAAAGTGNIADTQFHQDLLNVARNANSGLAGQEPAQRQMIGMLGQIYDAAVGGRLNGEVYQNLTQKGSALSNALDRTSPIRQYAIPVREALDSALGRANPGAQSEINLARNQYRNAILLEKLENEDTGVVDPKKLASTIRANYGGMGQASAAGLNAGNPVDMGVLAGGGKLFNSGAGVNPLIVGGAGAGLAGLGTLAAEHEGLPILETLGQHPVAGALAGGTLAGLYGAGGMLQNTPLARNILLSGGPGFVGNPLIPATAAAKAYRPGPTPENAETTAYIRQAAKARGIDPDIALKVAQSEGLGGAYSGDQGSSFGPFQLHYGGVSGTSKGNAVPGLGDTFTAKTGLHASDPATTQAQIDFALDYAAKNGWAAWHGWQGDPLAGIPGASGMANPTSSSNLLTGSL